MTVPAPAAAAGQAAAASRGLPADSQCETSVAIFKQSWSTYQKLLQVDFLEHGVIYAALRSLLLQELAAASATSPLSMLDLGCGDASQIAACLRQCCAPAGPLRLGSYTGVDLSVPALELAAGALACLEPQCAVSLVEQDMKAFLGACAGQQYDLVFSSFAVHHLSLEGKAAFLAQIARSLKPGGLFVLVDVFRREGEERQQYMQRYEVNMGEAVTRGIIEPEEAATLMHHITNFDFPEQLSDYRQLATAAGFASADCLFTDSKEFGRLVVLRR